MKEPRGETSENVIIFDPGKEFWAKFSNVFELLWNFALKLIIYFDSSEKIIRSFKLQLKCIKTCKMSDSVILELRKSYNIIKTIFTNVRVTRWMDIQWNGKSTIFNMDY